MSKYIIRNCPCFVEGIAIKGNEQKTQTCNNHKIRELTYCQDCNYCVLKQIVSRLNNFAEDYGLDAGFYADELLSYLDIQEVE